MAKASKDSWWTRWLRNGRLSGLTFGVVLILHVTLTFFKLPTDGLQPVLILSAGAFVGNLALRKESEDREKKKVDDGSTD